MDKLFFYVFMMIINNENKIKQIEVSVNGQF